MLDKFLHVNSSELIQFAEVEQVVGKKLYYRQQTNKIYKSIEFATLARLRFDKFLRTRMITRASVPRVCMFVLYTRNMLSSRTDVNAGTAAPAPLVAVPSCVKLTTVLATTVYY